LAWGTACLCGVVFAVGAVAVETGAGAGRAGPPVFGGPADCVANTFCALGLRLVYGVDVSKRLRVLPPGPPTYAALRRGLVGVAVGLSSDPELRDPDFVQLADDRMMAGADNVVPLLAARVAKKWGAALGRYVNAISGQLSMTVLRKLNSELEAGESVAATAARWVSGRAFAPPARAKGGPRIVLAAQPFLQSKLLAQVYAKALAAGGYPTRVLAIDGYREEVLDAISAGSASMMVDYAASLLEYLDRYQGFRSRDTRVVLRLLRGYASQHGLEVLAPATARTVGVFVTTRETADRIGLTRLSDLRALGYPHVPTLAPPLAVSIAAGGDDTSGVFTVGSNGPQVARAQRRLNTLGYRAGTADGRFGEQTRRAIAWFQQENGLEPDGALGHATRRALAGSRAKRAAGALEQPGAHGTVKPSASKGTMYLTFDDGPGTPYTDRIRELLAHYRMHATFFVVGANVARHASVMRRLVASGDAIANHTFDHTDLSKASEQSMFSQLDATREAIRASTGKTTTCLRPPYGATNTQTVRLANRRGYKVVLWDVDPQDWARPGADSIARDVLSQTHAGSIVLLHDAGGDRAQTLAALREILPALVKRRLRSASLDCS